jgi:hypothetical protein
MLSTLYYIFALPLIMQIAGRIQFGAREVNEKIFNFISVSSH